MNRRHFLATTGLIAARAPQLLRADHHKVTAIGNRRELFIENSLIESLKGAEQRLHHPVPQEIALKHDAPWEGTGCGYHSVFHDGENYRMYYKAWHIDVRKGGIKTNRHPLFCCYAESDDGITWRKPDLGIWEFQGSKKNNITMIPKTVNGLKVDPGHPAVFMDENPNAAPDAKFKAIFRSASKSGLRPFKSPDGFNWSPMTSEPILHKLGAFDSQNLAFWDPTIGRYRAYWRIFSNGRRDIRTALSDDMKNWADVRDCSYEDSPPEHLYTNQVKHYHRAPHILIGFPTRYIDRGSSSSMSALPDPEHRDLRASSVKRYGHAVTETLLMASRDGIRFKRWNEAFLRPGIERPGTWHYGAQYMGWHCIETKSALPGAPNEISLFATESYWHGRGSNLRRYTLRLDGFVSVHAGMKGGELVTMPITFKGKQLELNFATSAVGGLRVEIQDKDGKAIPGYALADCPVTFGDTVKRTVTWKTGKDVGKLAGKPIRLRFELRDANLYSYRFV